jgi:TonB-linked SusC/RagA family outer membrane protein
MKLTTLLLFAGLLQLSAKSFSQVRLSLNYKSAPIEKVFKAIGRKSHYTFLYKDNMIPEKKIDIHVVDMPVPEIMNRLLAGTSLSYRILSNKLIVITHQNEQVSDTTIQGRVLSASGEPLNGVSIGMKGSTLGTVTNAAGQFSLTVPLDAVLEVRYLGYTTRDITVKGRKQFNIALQPSSSSLNEVVVVGYGSQRKSDLTGAVSEVKADEVNWKPVGQLSEALAGVASGVTVTQGSGQPGEDQGTIRIRGIGTLNNNDPLVLIDGVQSSINDIDPNDIATISILKDAAAASIYGVRAANGVILVTTKRGQKGKPKVSYSDYFGWQKPTRLSKFVGAQQYMKLINLMHKNSGSGAVYSDADIAAYDDPNRDVNKYPDNYWLKKVLTGSGFQQQHSLAVSGGGDHIKYRFSTNYLDQKGLIQNMDYSRLTVRLNTNIEVTSKLSFTADMAAKLGDRKEPQDNGEGSAWFQFGQAAVMNPTIVDKYTDGTWGIGRGDGNPIRIQQEGGIFDYKDNLITGNFRADYKLLKGLTLSGVASVNYEIGFNSLHDVALTYYNFFDNHSVIATKGQNDVTKQYTDYWFKDFQGLAHYTRQVGQHHFSLLAGISRLTERNDNLSGYRKGLPNGELEQIDAGASEGQTASGTASEYGLLSFFGRLNYAFKNKYLLEANIRRDGSSRFAPGQKWGVFPSFSLGWRISSEGFMQQVRFIQDLKLRGSWGKLGNDAIGDYPYQSIYDLNNSYPFGGTLNAGAGLDTYPNSSLSWETTKMTDVGLDFTMLSGRLSVTYDYYIKNTDDILLQLPIPQTVGLSAPYQNAGAVQNKGWELNVAYNGKIGKDLTFRVGANLSDVRNKITDLKGADQIQTTNNNPGEITRATKTGLPIGAFYGYIAQGIFQSQDQVDKHAQQGGQTGPGDLIYKDQNGDNQINASDYVYLGSDIPRYTYGINVNLGYRNFDLTAFFQGVGKVDINTVVLKRAPINSDNNFKTIHEDSWTPDNPDASFPRLVSTLQNYASSSYWIESGAYLRLKSLQLGYTLPEKILSHSGFSGLRVFVSGQNLLTWSGLEKDIDPEAPDDYRYYPQVKVFTFGVNVNF